MANRGACLHDGTLTGSPFDSRKRPGAPAERLVAFTPAPVAEADVVQAADPRTLEKSLGLIYLRDVTSRHVSFNGYPPRALPTKNTKNGVRVMRHAVELQFRSRRRHVSQECVMCLRHTVWHETRTGAQFLSPSENNHLGYRL